MVPRMIPSCRLNPQNTPAYFLKAGGQILKAMMNEASNLGDNY
jgi:hypothetical protein